jgi:hypothetical protein
VDAVFDVGSLLQAEKTRAHAAAEAKHLATLDAKQLTPLEILHPHPRLGMLVIPRQCEHEATVAARHRGGILQ